MSLLSLARPVPGPVLPGPIAGLLVTSGSGGALLLDQGRGVPWGGVLTVLGTWAQALLT